MKRTISFLFIFLILFSIVGCGIEREPIEINTENTTDDNEIEEAHIEYEIPNVYAVRCYYYERKSNGEYSCCGYLFFDQEGNEYSYDTEENISMEVEEVYKKFVNGSLEEVKFIESYAEQDGVNRCLDDLQEVINRKDFKLEYSSKGYSLCVEPDYYIEWYGFYYDENKNLQKKIFFMEEQNESIKASDKSAVDLRNRLFYPEDYR